MNEFTHVISAISFLCHSRNSHKILFSIKPKNNNVIAWCNMEGSVCLFGWFLHVLVNNWAIS